MFGELLNAALEFVGSGASTVGNIFSGIAEYLPTAAQAGSFAAGAMPFLTAGAQLTPAVLQFIQSQSQSPLSGLPQSMSPTSSPDPNAIRQIVANRQTQGIYSGGAASPESLSNLFGGEYSPEEIEMFLSQRSPLGGS